MKGREQGFGLVFTAVGRVSKPCAGPQALLVAGHRVPFMVEPRHRQAGVEQATWPVKAWE